MTVYLIFRHELCDNERGVLHMNHILGVLDNTQFEG